MKRVHVPGEMTICLMVSLFCAPPVFPFSLFIDFDNFSLSCTLSHTLSVKLVFTLLLFSLCSHYGLKPLLPFSMHPPPLPLHSLCFSVVPPGGCSFVPPSFSPFWSGTGADFLLSLFPLCSVFTLLGF